MSIARATIALVLGLSLGACGGPAGSPTAAPTASPTPAPTAHPTPTPAPTGTPVPVLDWPTDSAIPLSPGQYQSSPPFDIQFTIEIPAGPWGSAHLNGEFFDFMNVTEMGVQPTRWVAFAHPEAIYGRVAAPADSLTPRAAADLLAGLDDVVAGPISDTSLDGIAGVRVDFTTNFANVHLFGGPAGAFGLDPTLAARVTILPHSADGDLLFVLVMAPDSELEDAWAELQPILDTIRF